MFTFWFCVVAFLVASCGRRGLNVAENQVCIGRKLPNLSGQASCVWSCDTSSICEQQMSSRVLRLNTAACLFDEGSLVYEFDHFIDEFLWAIQVARVSSDKFFNLSIHQALQSMRTLLARRILVAIDSKNW